MRTAARGVGGGAATQKKDGTPFSNTAARRPQAFARQLTAAAFAAARARADFDDAFVDRSPAEIAMRRAATWGR